MAWSCAGRVDISASPLRPGFFYLLVGIEFIYMNIFFFGEGTRYVDDFVSAFLFVVLVLLQIAVVVSKSALFSRVYQNSLAYLQASLDTELSFLLSSWSVTYCNIQSCWATFLQSYVTVSGNAMSIVVLVRYLWLKKSQCFDQCALQTSSALFNLRGKLFSFIVIF